MSLYTILPSETSGLKAEIENIWAQGWSHRFSQVYFIKTQSQRKHCFPKHSLSITVSTGIRHIPYHWGPIWGGSQQLTVRVKVRMTEGWMSSINVLNEGPQFSQHPWVEGCHSSEDAGLPSLLAHDSLLESALNTEKPLESSVCSLKWKHLEISLLSRNPGGIIIFIHWNQQFGSICCG